MDDRILINETNARFWARTGYKSGQKLDMSDPKDRAMAKVWLRIYAEVQDYSNRATSLARRIYGATFMPYIFVGERPDGYVSHLAFQQRGELDVQFSSAVSQPEQYTYIAMFDLTKNPRGPLFDHFAFSASLAVGSWWDDVLYHTRKLVRRFPHW